MAMKRRELVAAVPLVMALGFKSHEAKAFLGPILRLIFGLGVRGAGRAAVGGAARAAVARGAVAAGARGLATAGARSAIIGRGAAQLAQRVATARALPASRLSSFLQKAQRVQPGKRVLAGAAAAGAATPAAAGGVSLVDLIWLGTDLANVFDSGSPSAAIPVPTDQTVESLQVEIVGSNTSADVLNGVLSIAMWDQAFHEGREGLFAREVLPLMLAPRPGEQFHFVHEVLLDAEMTGRWYVCPALSRLGHDGREVEVKGFAFEPALQALDITPT